MTLVCAVLRGSGIDDAQRHCPRGARRPQARAYIPPSNVDSRVLPGSFHCGAVLFHCLAASIFPHGEANCNSRWGRTEVDWQLAFQTNGNYISNARIIANVRAAWGMNVVVRVTPTTHAVNIGTISNPIAQASFDLFFQSQGGWAAYYTLQSTITFDGTGNVRMSPRMGSFC